MLKAATLTLEPGVPVDVAVAGPHATTLALVRPVQVAPAEPEPVVYLRGQQSAAEDGRGVPLTPARGISGVEVGTSDQVWLEAPDGADVDVVVVGA